ncbi:MAG: pitrilysin family protein [Cyanobacteriota bacterium]|nr:pitrilysin family protein [Cyanobacteriota bacterium]
MKKTLLTIAILLCGSIVWASEPQLYKLDNGQTVIIQEIHNNPIVSIDTWIKTGSIDEDESNNGVAHFLEHLFFKGTKNHAPGEFDRILETKGAVTNAATSKDFTHYYITIPSKDFDLAMDLHSDMLLNPMIPRNEMEKERKVVLEEINKDSSSPQRKMYENIDSMMYTNHPYKRRVIGQSSIIETITREKVLDFYNAHYSPSNMVTLVVGDVDTAHALDKIKQDFGSNMKKTEKKVYPKEQQLTEQKKKVDYIDTKTGYMLIGFRGTPISDKDSYALDVLSTILGEGRASVLNQVLKEKKRLAFSVGAGNATSKDDGIFYISANFEPAKCKLVQDAIFNEIKNIQDKGVTEDQLNLAKNVIERNTYYSRESVTNISEEMGYTAVLTGDIKYYENYLDNIKKVTPEEVKKVAIKYLGENRSAISILLPDGSKDVPVANKTTQQKVVPELVSQNSQTQEYKLPNKSTLLYTKNDVNDIIAISIDAKGGQLLENKAGVAYITGATMLKGTKTYSPLELSQILEVNGIKITPSVSADTFNISVLTTKDEYDKTIELLNEIINNASFDEVELGKVKSDKLNQIKAGKDIPLQVALEKYRELIFQNSPYTISSNVIEKNIPNITRDDVVAYYNKIFNPENIVISVNGNIDKDKVAQDFNGIFSSENSGAFDYSKYDSEIPHIASPKIVTQKLSSTETAWIMLGWQTQGITNEKDYATLQVIDSLLGSGMSSRMFKDLREKEGLAYQLGSGLSAHKLRSSFVLYIGTNPATLDKAKQGLFDEINKLKTEYVGDGELKDAKEKLIGNYVIGMETNLDKASALGDYETLGLGYDFKDKYIDLINSVTDMDIIETANKYFNNNYVLSIVTK